MKRKAMGNLSVRSIWRHRAARKRESTVWSAVLMVSSDLRAGWCHVALMYVKSARKSNSSQFDDLCFFGVHVPAAMTLAIANPPA
jgi:hypothetical protein